MAKANSPIKLGSRVHVTNHGKGKVVGFAGSENQVVFVELENGGEVTASKEVVRRAEVED